MNLRNCYNFQGNFVPKLYFTEKYNLIPNVYEITLSQDDAIDISKLSEMIPELFGQNAVIIGQAVYDNETSTSAVDDDEDEFYKGGEWVQTSFKLDDEQHHRFWEFNKTGISVLHHEKHEDIKKYVDDIRIKLPKIQSKPKAAEIGLIAYDNGYFTINSKIVKTDLNIEESYNDDFIPVFEDIKKFLNSRSSGLVILNGTKGTGKTTLIRHMCSQHPKKYRIVTNAIASRLAEPEFMSYLLENKDSVFVLEDCEQILMDRSENTFGGAISNILNMSDGLMSDIFNIKFICTFNADINKIDSALLRKGRCYANYEFKPLSIDKVKALSEKHNLSINVTKPMTLAEIYNYESTDYDSSAKPKKKIGF